MGVEQRRMGQPFPQPSAGSLALRGLRRIQAVVPEQLERHLLRRTVGILEGERSSCADCGRAPLIGEWIHLYGAAEIVCELCRPLRQEAPVSSEPVRHGEFGHTVKVTRRISNA